jgi:hypothetical protein
VNASSIITSTTITRVWTALGGDPPIRGRARAFYRDGTNQQAVSLDDEKGCWFDHRDHKGGGVLDLIQHVRGGDRSAALRWLADLNGVPLDDEPATYAERRAFAERRESEQRDLRAAEFFRLAAVSLADHLLDDVLPEGVPERYWPTQLRLTLRGAQGAMLLSNIAIFSSVNHASPQGWSTPVSGPGIGCVRGWPNSLPPEWRFWMSLKPSSEALRILHGFDQPKENPELLVEPGRSTEILPAFPNTAWRGVFADYREAMIGTTEASDVAHFTACWAAVAATLGRRVSMYAGERIFPNVYLSVFGPTGDKKTTAQRRILNCGLLAPSIQVIRNLGSTEGLADALKREERTDMVALFFWEELTTLFARGRWSGSTILEFFTETFDCPPEWGIKYRKEPINLVAPTPTILAGTTCEWFWKNARSDDFFGGLGNRFLYLTGAKKKPIANPSEPVAALLRRVQNALASCRNFIRYRHVSMRPRPVSGHSFT